MAFETGERRRGKVGKVEKGSFFKTETWPSHFQWETETRVVSVFGEDGESARAMAGSRSSPFFSPVTPLRKSGNARTSGKRRLVRKKSFFEQFLELFQKNIEKHVFFPKIH